MSSKAKLAKKRAKARAKALALSKKNYAKNQAANAKNNAKAEAAKLKAKKEAGYNEQLSLQTPEQQALQKDIIKRTTEGLPSFNQQQAQQEGQQANPNNAPFNPDDYGLNPQPQPQQQEQGPQDWQSYLGSIASGAGKAAYNYASDPSQALGMPGSQIDKTYKEYQKKQQPSGLGLLNSAYDYASGKGGSLQGILGQAGEYFNSGEKDYSWDNPLSQAYDYATQTDYGQDNLSHQQVQQGFDPYERQMRQGFNEGTVPGLAERFTSLGGGRLSSPSFVQQLGRAGTGLESDIGAARETYRQGQQQYGLQNRQLGLNQRDIGQRNRLQRSQLGLQQEGQRQQYGLQQGEQERNDYRYGQGLKDQQSAAQQAQANQDQQFGLQRQQLGLQHLGQNRDYETNQQKLGLAQQELQGNNTLNLARLGLGQSQENLYHAPQLSFGKQLLGGLVGQAGNIAASYAGAPRR